MVFFFISKQKKQKNNITRNTQKARKTKQKRTIIEQMFEYRTRKKNNIQGITQNAIIKYKIK